MEKGDYLVLQGKKEKTKKKIKQLWEKILMNENEVIREKRDDSSALRDMKNERGRGSRWKWEYVSGDQLKEVLSLSNGKRRREIISKAKKLIFFKNWNSSREFMKKENSCKETKRNLKKLEKMSN